MVACARSEREGNSLEEGGEERRERDGQRWQNGWKARMKEREEEPWSEKKGTHKGPLVN